MLLHHENRMVQLEWVAVLKPLIDFLVVMVIFAGTRLTAGTVAMTSNGSGCPGGNARAGGQSSNELQDYGKQPMLEESEDDSSDDEENQVQRDARIARNLHQ
jgi:hypothetical protein